MGKKKDEHHGGAWKVAYADFVTAMMALFIVLWICKDKPKLAAMISSQFKVPLAEWFFGGSQDKEGQESIDEVRMTQDEIDKTIEILRKQRTLWDEAGRAAADGDRVTIDFIGTLDGVAFNGGSATDFPFVLGEGRMLSDFESGVRGASADSKVTFEVAFPADYSAPDLAGKTAQFEVTVRKVESPRLPALDADFAVALGVADGDLVKLRSDVRGNLEREVGQRLANLNNNAVMEALPKLAEFEVPKALSRSES
jgi:trigger factor